MSNIHDSNMPAGEYAFNGVFNTAMQERKCDRCNYPIKHFYSVTHSETKTLYVVGSECVKLLTGKSVSQHAKEIKEAAKREEIERQERVRLQSIAEFKAAHAAEFERFNVVADYITRYNIDNEFILSLIDYYAKFETLSEKQLAAVVNYYPDEKLDMLRKSAELKPQINKIMQSLATISLSSWDRDFYMSLHEFFYNRGYLTEKQFSALQKMASRYVNAVKAIVV